MRHNHKFPLFNSTIMNNETTVTLKLDKEYFTEAFEQSIKYASKWRKAEWVIGTLFIIGGILLLVWSSGNTASPIVLILIGIFEIFSPIIKKFWWVGRQMKSKIANSEVKMTFSDTGFHSSSLYSKGEFSWDGLERTLETPKGFFIWPQKGIHIYLPKSLVSSDLIQFIINKSA